MPVSPVPLRCHCRSRSVGDATKRPRASNEESKPYTKRNLPAGARAHVSEQYSGLPGSLYSPGACVWMQCARVEERSRRRG